MSLLDRIWYQKIGLLNAPIILPLLPLTALFKHLSKVRRDKYKKGIKPSLRTKVPVIVVGGISVGGTGKTPLCIALLQKLNDLGYKVGLLSRGYKGKAEHYPYIVETTSNVKESGDEPLLIKMSVKNKAVVVVDPNRERGAQYLEHLGVDVIVTDDGLQHYALQRDIEIIVLDGKRMLGNGLLLPAGPLREGEWRLKTTDLVVTNGTPTNSKYDSEVMQLRPSQAVSIDSFCSKTEGHEYLQVGTKIIALAGIGNPKRFYKTLEDCGYLIESSIDIGDHGLVSKKTLENLSVKYPIVMTAKDAVKYAQYKINNLYVLNVEAELSDNFYSKIADKLYDLVEAYESKSENS